ncbi:hypothetical protein HELRODRAFT_169431 [Helobdella robusta]|uniref:Uncharacterized protein n=1 Tax=Helobdella robusta TaxID=6412 RepID=T1F1X3_HELRO|nr:hypothetical protein HELRODRAFT_169431 [Helobdella robusta]ESO08557.1 hypothetical protein HELRODRAFT_169431 [Helobdella robusta]
MAGDHLDRFFNKKLFELRFVLERVSLLPVHDALTIIRGALSLPKLMYFLRTSNSVNAAILGEFAGALRVALSAICNEPSDIAAHDGKRPDGCGEPAGACRGTLPFRAPLLSATCSLLAKKAVWLQPGHLTRRSRSTPELSPRWSFYRFVSRSSAP